MASASAELEGYVSRRVMKSRAGGERWMCKRCKGGEEEVKGAGSHMYEADAAVG